MWTLVAKLVIYAIVAYVSYEMREEPDEPDPAGVEDFDVPSASENRPIPVVFGTVRITGANVVWYGDLETEEITEEVDK